MNIDNLRDKCQKEYQSWLQHIQPLRAELEKADFKVLETPPEGFVKSNMLWQHMQLELATFLTDELDIIAMSDKGVLEDEIMANTEIVAKHYYRKMDMKEKKRKIIDDNNMYWLSATFISSFDEDENIPDLDTIDAMSIIPDPKNYSGSKMRFIWLEKQMSLWFLKEYDKFDKKVREEVIATISEEWRKTELSRGNASGVTVMPDDDMVSVYYHFTSFEGKKYMTVWANNFAHLLRQVELEPLTKAEKLNPAKVRFPIQLHRRKPIPWSFFGASLYKEVIEYQKNESELLTLKMQWVRIEELGSDKILNAKLGIDLNMLKKEKSWGITMNGDFSDLNGEAPFVELPLNRTWWRVDGMLEQNSQLSYNTSWNQPISFGQSAPWAQTKWEAQILDQRANKTHRMVRDNYMDSYQQMWEDIFREVAKSMSEKAEIRVALFDSWTKTSKTLRKKDFIPDGNINIYIESRDEVRQKNEQDFNKLVTVSNLIIKNSQPWYGLNTFLRTIIEKSWTDLNAKQVIPESPDEIEAKANLSLLNQDKELADPLPWQDLMTLRHIYSQALPTKARDKILGRLDELILDWAHKQVAQVPQTDAQSSAMAMNAVQSQANNNPTLWL